jgi:hypothetical protein
MGITKVYSVKGKDVSRAAAYGVSQGLDQILESYSKNGILRTTLKFTPYAEKEGLKVMRAYYLAEDIGQILIGHNPAANISEVNTYLISTSNSIDLAEDLVWDFLKNSNVETRIYPNIKEQTLLDSTINLQNFLTNSEKFGKDTKVSLREILIGEGLVGDYLKTQMN